MNEEWKTHSAWGPECQGTAAEHPERPAVWRLRGSPKTQSPSHQPPPTHHTSANKHTAGRQRTANYERIDFKHFFSHVRRPFQSTVQSEAILSVVMVAAMLGLGGKSEGREISC